MGICIKLYIDWGDLFLERDLLKFMEEEINSLISLYLLLKFNCEVKNFFWNYRFRFI